MPTPLAIGVALPARSTSAEVKAVAEELVRTTTAMSVELGAAVRPATAAKRPGRPSRIA
jgi:hypothetical protein